MCFKDGQQLSQVVCPAHLRAQAHRDETSENVQFKHVCPDTLTCLKFLQSTLVTASDGRTDPADTEDRMAATVATPKVSL